MGPEVSIGVGLDKWVDRRSFGRFAANMAYEATMICISGTAYCIEIFSYHTLSDSLVGGT